MGKAMVLAAAQRFADAMAACEYWRTRDAYPHDKWRAAWVEQQAALSGLMMAAGTLPPVLPTPEAPHE